ncbi:MAG: hypothetical protein SAK29_38385 [Scytonema sp. PMC 1069.18]|nr:hypothetical protein [Scytonema sp. PMC 1069.18]MEC4884054.1 hypothetical protein [Scytonema sp. PMC 1070.18]
MKVDQHEQLFTELTPTEAAVVEGGKGFAETVYFDASDSTRSFTVSDGGTIELFTNTYNIGGSNPTFYAAIRTVSTGRKNEKAVSVGNDTTRWTNVKGGTYVIDFRDREDNIYVYGPIGVYYS